MRRVLVDHARGKNAAKREGLQQKLALDEAVSFANEKEFDVLALKEALARLEKQDPGQAKIVELRFYEPEEKIQSPKSKTPFARDQN